MNQHEQADQCDSGYSQHEGRHFHDQQLGELRGGVQGMGGWGRVPHVPHEGPQGQPVDLQRTMAAEAEFELPRGGFEPGSGNWGHVPQAPHAGQLHEEFDPEYRRWRKEQMRAMDEDYHAWRQDRYRQFADEFNQWRSRRIAEQGGRSGEKGR